MLQLQKENDYERIELEKLGQENDLFKNLLAAALEKAVSKNSLEHAEYFQTEFLKKDEIIKLLKHEYYLLMKKEDAKTAADFAGRQEKFQNSVGFLKNEFIKLKKDFNRYLKTVEQ